MIPIKLTATDIKNIIAFFKVAMEEWLPWAIKHYNDKGRMPSGEQIKAMLKDIKDPEYYDTLYPRREE